MSTPFVQVDQSFHSMQQGKPFVCWPTLTSKLLFPPWVFSRSCKHDAVWKLRRTNVPKIGNMNPIKWTESFLPSRMNLPIQTSPRVIRAIIGTKKRERQLSHFFLTETVVVYFVRCFVISHVSLWCTVIAVFQRLRYDVSRARGYLYVYNLCSSCIAFTLPSPSPSFLLRHVVVLLSFHGHCDQE